MVMSTSTATGYARMRWEAFADEITRTTEWSHSGVAVLSGDRVVIASPAPGDLVVVSGLCSAQETMDVVPVPIGFAHGIFGSGGDAVVVADPGLDAGEGQVVRVDLTTGASEVIDPPVEAEGRWRPTSIAVDERGTLWVADGYGDSRMWMFPVGKAPQMIDGSETGTLFDCPHGVVIDDRGDEPHVLVADRGNRRVVAFTLAGALVRVITHPLLTSPSSLARRGDDILITDLFGALLRLDRDDEVESIIPLPERERGPAWPNVVDDAGANARPRLHDDALNSPHGIAVDESGRIFLTEWMIGGRQIRLTVCDSGLEP